MDPTAVPQPTPPQPVAAPQAPLPPPVNEVAPPTSPLPQQPPVTTEVVPSVVPPTGGIPHWALYLAIAAVVATAVGGGLYAYSKFKMPAAVVTTSTTASTSGQVATSCVATTTFTSLGDLPSDLTKVCSLDLRNQGLSAVPVQVLQMANLQALFMSHNKITSLPNGLFALKNLTTLSLGSNSLTEVPPGIGGLSSLTFLNLSTNQIRAVPTEISKLIKLQTLYLDGDPIPASDQAKIKALLPQATITF